MIMLAVKHTVSDYDAWKSVFDDYPPTAHGAVFHRINRDLEDPNTVLVVSGFTTADAANAFITDPELKEKMGEAGVVGAPRFEMYEEIESSEA